MVRATEPSGPDGQGWRTLVNYDTDGSCEKCSLLRWTKSPPDQWDTTLQTVLMVSDGESNPHDQSFSTKVGVGFVHIANTI